MLSFYSVPASKPWGRPENIKGTMGKAPEVQGPAALHSYRTGWTTEAFCFACREHLDTTSVLRIPRNNGAHRFYMFSFLDARNAHNRLRWIGKTQKMAGTSGNSFNGSYRVHGQGGTWGEAWGRAGWAATGPINGFVSLCFQV